MKASDQRKSPSFNQASSSPQGPKPSLHARAVSDSSEQLRQFVAPKLAEAASPRLGRRCSMIEPGIPPDLDDLKSPQTAIDREGRWREKRNSVILTHCPFPQMSRQDSLFPEVSQRKPDSQIREEIALLTSLGMKTSAALPKELQIFKDRPKTKLVMSTFDLWGPQYARNAVRAMGCYEAFRTLEGRDRRASIRLETEQEIRFNSRMADDASTMKALNTPMVTSPMFPDQRPFLHTEHGKTESMPKRGQPLLAILQSCDELQVENRRMRKTLTPILSTPTLRRKPATRNSIS